MTGQTNCSNGFGIFRTWIAIFCTYLLPIVIDVQLSYIIAVCFWILTIGVDLQILPEKQAWPKSLHIYVLIYCITNGVIAIYYLDFIDKWSTIILSGSLLLYTSLGILIRRPWILDFDTSGILRAEMPVAAPLMYDFFKNISILWCFTLALMTTCCIFLSRLVLDAEYWTQYLCCAVIVIGGLYATRQYIIEQREMWEAGQKLLLESTFESPLFDDSCSDAGSSYQPLWTPYSSGCPESGSRAEQRVKSQIVVKDFTINEKSRSQSLT